MRTRMMIMSHMTKAASEIWPACFYVKRKLAFKHASWL
jgi:hypothetical protein